MNFNSQWMDKLKDPDLWTNVGVALLKVIVIIILAKIVSNVFKKMITRWIEEQEKRQNKRIRRAKTLGKLVGNVVTYTVNFIAIMLVLAQLGFDLLPLIAGAGVIGLAIGFGAQNLVKDVITGFFILFEDQFAVGDVVQIGSNKGTVEEIGLRVTKLKGWTGEVHYIPNGSISQVTNYSIYHSLSIIDVSVSYDSDLGEVKRIIEETVKQVKSKNENIVGEPKVLGVQKLGASDIVIRVETECRPTTEDEAGRMIIEELKKAMDTQNMKFHII